MKHVKISLIVISTIVYILPSCKKDIAPGVNFSATTANDFREAAQPKFIMPPEDALHEGTWLQWPHQYTYGYQYRNRLEPTWVAMVKVLAESEQVHIIAYNNTEKNRILTQLLNANISLAGIDFTILQTNDCWVRDNGPVFVKSTSGNLVIEDWGFNGWGQKTPYKKDDLVPTLIANAMGYNVNDLGKKMELEGGAVTIDGNGTFMGTKSSILNPNRNAGMSQQEAENILKINLGITNFIWLDGAESEGDITDGHIDGFAAFAPGNIIVTMNKTDLRYWYISNSDIDRIYTAVNKDGQPYSIVKLPLTKKNVVTAYGKNLGYKGSYCNFYIANTNVLVPVYNDTNDAVAINILQSIFPGRNVVGIDCRNLYEQGGMVHCVTQQQPVE